MSDTHKASEMLEDLLTEGLDDHWVEYPENRAWVSDVRGKITALEAENRELREACAESLRIIMETECEYDDVQSIITTLQSVLGPDKDT